MIINRFLTGCIVGICWTMMGSCADHEQRAGLATLVVELESGEKEIRTVDFLRMRGSRERLVEVLGDSAGERVAVVTVQFASRQSMADGGKIKVVTSWSYEIYESNSVCEIVKGGSVCARYDVSTRNETMTTATDLILSDAHARWLEARCAL